MIAKTEQSHICLREDKLSFDNNYIVNNKIHNLLKEVALALGYA